MQEKTITIIIDAQGKSTLDLEGFAGQSCEKVFDDFRGGDSVKMERKKANYYTGQQVQQEKSQRWVRDLEVRSGGFSFFVLCF